MKLVLLNVQSAKEPWAAEAFDLYTKKISAFFPFEIKEIKPKRAGRDQKEVKLKEESELILKELKVDDFVVLFDERGKSLDSVQFAKEFERNLSTGKKRIVFVIGGAFGVGDEVRSRAQSQVSLSKMVLNHLVAQTVALEQIYRALTIQKNIPYHNP